jgi:RHS repeat-associated protein
VALLDSGGNIVERYSYNERGTSWYGNRFMFQGREWINELGIYDYRHRVYNPGLGRFLQSDPTGFDAGDMNLFRYCGDDPLDGSDPMGLFDMWSNLTRFYNGNPSMDVVQDAWNERRSPAGTDGGGLVRWSDEGNRNQHEPVVKGKDGKSYNALTEPELKVTAADGVITAHYIINVRYSDKVGPHNKERQKLEPDHGNEIDNEFRYNRGPKAIERLTRPGGPLEGKSLETQRSMIEHVLRVPFESAAEATRERHDNLNPLKGPIGDHPIIHPDGLNY